MSLSFAVPTQTVRVTVCGANFFNDTVEGTAYNFTKLFVIVPMDSSRGNAKGFATTEYRYDSSDLFHKIQHLPFPHEADLILETVTNGKTKRELVRDYKPVTRQDVGKVADAVGGKREG
ncbi:hypothetical protein [Chitinimonas koreensis]|uniref:hypothetical protein n=1 Tax=Chitinimonas koreensis TaxID=356302 RepID=UPI00040045DC|nr:hypothetical protein [Chitinimonas koreensis]QNM98687.1 hypothetical protein H9L41_10955 [Chitinimonas koreensis]